MSAGMPLKRKVSFKLAHGHMCLDFLSKYPWDTWNQEHNKTEERFWVKRDQRSHSASPFCVFSLQLGKLSEALPLLWAVAKHVHHLMNKQLSVCLFLQMVCLPPPSLFCPSRCASYCLIPLAHRALLVTETDLDSLLPPGASRKQNKTESTAFRWSQLHNHFFCC